MSLSIHFIANVYEDFARLRSGMCSAKFKTPYTSVVLDLFDEAYFFYKLAKRMGLTCAICTGEKINKDWADGRDFIFLIAHPNEYGHSTSEALKEHYRLLKRKQEKEHRRFRRMKRRL